MRKKTVTVITAITAFGGALSSSVATRACSFSPYRARIGGGCGQILVISVTAVTDDEYGLEDPCVGSETCFQEVGVVRDARERRMYV